MTTTAPVTITIEGLRVQAELNQRGHWRFMHARKVMQQDIVIAALLRLDRAAFRAAPRLRVRFTRLKGPRGRDMDDDNLVGAFKHVRDAVAHWLGVDDGDRWFDWRYDPEQVRGADYGVKISFEALPAAGVSW